MKRPWTPERLAAAICATPGMPRVSGRTLRRACINGDIEADRTPGGYYRIPERVIRARWPQVIAHHDGAADLAAAIARAA